MRLFGLIGMPLSHSFSQRFFTEKFKEEGVADCQYQNFEIDDVSRLREIINNNAGLEGVNVTIPYKQDVLQFIDQADEAVRQIGACNCIKIARGKLFGFNTDVVGFWHSLQPLLQPQHKKALVLGSGGASRAVQHALTKLQIEWTLVSTTPFPGRIRYDAIDQDLIQQHTLIINTTPLGMYPNVDDCPAIPYHFLTHKHLLFDLIYNPEKTRFLLEGEKQGATICNGYEMLVGQALESWRIWNDPLLGQ